MNDYLKELEEEINGVDDDDEDRNSLTGLVVDVDTIREKYERYTKMLKQLIDTDNLEEFSGRLNLYNKEALLTIKRQLNGIRDCYVEFMLSNSMEDAAAIDYELVRKKLRLTQERIDFMNLKEAPVRMLDLISDEEVVEIIYEFLKTAITVIDLSRFSPEAPEVEEFNDTLTRVKHEIGKNKNKSDIQMVSLDLALQELFAKMNIKTIDDLVGLSDEMKNILAKAIAINAENDRLAAIYDGNYGIVKTYQDAVANRPDLSNKAIESVMQIIYGEIKEGVDTNILVIQGRQGFIDQTKKSVVGKLLRSGLYKALGLKSWIDTLLSDLYTNLQNYR